MKCFLSILLSFVLVIILILPSVALSKEQIVFSDSVLTDTINFDYQNTSSNLTGSITPYYYKNNNGRYIQFSSSSLLNSNQLKLFNAIKAAPIGSLTVVVSYNHGEMLKSELTTSFLSDIMNVITYELPQIFYNGGYSVRYSYNKNTNYITSIEYTIAILNTVLNYSENGVTTQIPVVATHSSDNAVSRWSAIEAVLKNTSFDTTNRYNFLKSVHDYLCNNIIYPDFKSEYYTGDCHDAYGALINGYAVCQGYACAFKLICDYYKIPCVSIIGTGNGGSHMWNAVQMDDGMWYLVDATWDDQYKIFYDFYLSGTDTVCSNIFGGTAFKVSHIPSSSQLLPTLTYSAVKYAEADHNTAFKATYNSLAKDDGNYLVRSYFDVKDTYIYYNGMYVEAENLTTNQNFTAPSGNNYTDESWTMVLIGDCNGDGACNALDYSDAVNKVLSDAEVVTAGDMAADADCDGVLDVIDISIIERAVSGSNTNIVIE